MLSLSFLSSFKLWRGLKSFQIYLMAAVQLSIFHRYPSDGFL